MTLRPTKDAVIHPDLEELASLAREKAQKVMKKVPLLGPVTWLMMASAATRHTLVSELEWRVVPPLILDQAKLYFRDETPVAYASWARLSDEAAQRYQQRPHQLTPGDWNSGPHLWLVDVLVPYGNAQEVMKDLRETVFKGQTVRQLIPAEGAHAQVLTWPVS